MTSGRSSDVQFHYTQILDERETAIRLEIAGELYWLPKSQITLYSNSQMVSIPEWLAEKNEML